MEKFNELYTTLNEASKDKLFFIQQGNIYTLWLAYDVGSGTTTIFKGSPEGYLTDKKGHEKFDDIVKVIAKQFPFKKVIEIPVYKWSFSTTSSSQNQLSVFGGSRNPDKKAYMVITKNENFVINFFTSRSEAKFWIN